MGVDWDDEALAVSSDSALVAKYRRLQSWYREVQLGVRQAGIGANDKHIGSMLPTEVVEAHPSLNFFNLNAYAHAETRIEEVRGEKGTLPEDRLRRNLLSSTPLCFNVFGAIGQHPAFLVMVQSLFDPDATEIVEVVCEWAPQPPADYLDDRSAFDALVVYLTGDGRRRFVGIETKYTELFSPTVYDSQRYRDVTANCGWFTQDCVAELSASSTNQLWQVHPGGS